MKIPSGKSRAETRARSQAKKTLASAASEVDSPAHTLGVVVRAHGRHFVVRSLGHDYLCELRGMIKKGARDETPVVVGDDVEYQATGDDAGIILKVLPRRTKFFRPSKLRQSDRQVLTANIDQLVTIASLGEPALKPRLIDRFLVSAQLGGLESVVVINKIDLSNEADDSNTRNEIATARLLKSGYEKIGVPCYLVSVASGAGMEELARALMNKRSLVVGHSGVGKSTLVNALIPGLDLWTQTVSSHTSRGRHTTTHVELHELPQGGFIVDSPGLKSMGLWEVKRDDLEGYFVEFEPFLMKCRYPQCSHISEAGCAIREAVEDGAIPRFRYESFLTIRETL